MYTLLHLVARFYAYLAGETVTRVPVVVETDAARRERYARMRQVARENDDAWYRAGGSRD